MVNNRAARLGFPFPYALKKFFPAQSEAALLLTLHQLPLDDHLRRDAGMICARLPKHILAAHPLEPAENILQGRVERVAHMQGTGDIRRRNDDCEGFRPCPLRPACPESARLFPRRRNTAFDRLGIESLFHHEIIPRVACAHSHASRKSQLHHR